jgi:hypothetical protein
MPREQLWVGVIIACFCLAGFWYEAWLLGETRTGGWLVRRLGPDRARWAVRLLLAAGLAFGILLAANVIRPVRW